MPSIRPTRKFFSTHRTATIVGLTSEQINAIVGDECRVDDDGEKVVNSWRFLVGPIDAPEDQCERCGVWDYKGSHEWNQHSAYGSKDVLRLIFGDEHVK